jgi:hypothetical protein
MGCNLTAATLPDTSHGQCTIVPEVPELHGDSYNDHNMTRGGDEVRLEMSASVARVWLEVGSRTARAARAHRNDHKVDKRTKMHR